MTSKMTGPRFELDCSGLAALAENYPVDDDHSALLAIEAALPGTADTPLISGPCEIATELLADGDGAIDGLRVIILADANEAGDEDMPSQVWLASDVFRVSEFSMFDEPDENGGDFDAAEIIEHVVALANFLLEWSRR